MKGFDFSYQGLNLWGVMWQFKKWAVSICILQSFKIRNFSKASSSDSSLLLTKNGQYFRALIVLRTVIMEEFISVIQDSEECWKTRNVSSFSKVD